MENHNKELTEYFRNIIIEENRMLLDAEDCNYTIEISYASQSCKKTQKIKFSSDAKKIEIRAVYGIIQMEVNSYILFVTKANVIGEICHKKIYQIKQMQFRCLYTQEAKEDQIYIKGLKDIFNTKYFYFSDEYDLTNSLECLFNSNFDLNNRRLQYMYNSQWVDGFREIAADEWITGFISGFVQTDFNKIENYELKMGLISRRNHKRQGMRWLARGADIEGNTANTVQTQYILQTKINEKEFINSHVQLRGLFPFICTQNPNLKWSPQYKIFPNDELNLETIQKNYAQIQKDYENATLINLTEKKGQKKIMGEYLEKLHKQIKHIGFKLVWFDFHTECKGMKYENLANLLYIIGQQIDHYGYFEMELNKNKQDDSYKSFKKKSQTGIFRTNCMNSLDRTNVAQFVIARHILLEWLDKLDLLQKSKLSSIFEKLPDEIEKNFRKHWTTNAHVLSLLYSGTPAQKTDFTATGKRTFRGVIFDRLCGIKRYFLGNFFDSKKQDFIDFSLKKLKPKTNSSQRIRHSSFNSLYIIIFFALLLPFVLNYFLSTVLGEDSTSFVYLFIGTIVCMLLFSKLLQMSNRVIIRRPIKKHIM